MKSKNKQDLLTIKFEIYCMKTYKKSRIGSWCVYWDEVMERKRLIIGEK